MLSGIHEYGAPLLPVCHHFYFLQGAFFFHNSNIFKMFSDQEHAMSLNNRISVHLADARRESNSVLCKVHLVLITPSISFGVFNF